MLKKSAAALMGALVLVSFASAALAGEPIAGVDVNLNKNPGGSIVAKMTTGSDGGFVFDNLTAGSYQIQIMPETPTTRASINTTRSNIKHPNVALLNGDQVVTVAAELGAGAASTDIDITAPHGKIVGTVSRAAAASPSGAR